MNADQFAATLDALVFVHYESLGPGGRMCFACGASPGDYHSDGCEALPLVRFLTDGMAGDTNSAWTATLGGRRWIAEQDRLRAEMEARYAPVGLI